MAGEEFLKFNNGQKFSFSNFQEIKEDDLSGADAEIKRLFNIFAGDDRILQAGEAKGLWDKLKSAAGTNSLGDDQELDDSEIETAVKELGLNVEETTIDKIKNLFTTIFTKPEENDISEPTNLEETDASDSLSFTFKETDKDGNKIETTVVYDDEHVTKQICKKNEETVAILSYDYSEDPENPTTSTLYKNENGVIEEVETPKKHTLTLYEGDDVEKFDKDAVQLFQAVARYDENGNTFIVVQYGENLTKIAKKFNVKLADLMKLNHLKSDSIIQAGQELLIPGKFKASDKNIITRRSKKEVVSIANHDMLGKVYDKVLTSSFKEETVTPECAGKNVYEYAEKYLIKNGAVKTESGFKAKVNDLANELMVANGKEATYTAGSKVLHIDKTLNAQTVQKLKNAGFAPSQENQRLYSRFNYLTPQQQNNVISILNECKAQKITDKNIINNRILAFYPDIQLFETDVNVLKKPTRAMARKFAAQYFLEQIDNIIAIYNQVATSDKNLATLGTGLTVEVEDVLSYVASSINKIFGTNIDEGDARRTLAPMLNDLRSELSKLAGLASLEEKTKDQDYNEKKKYVPERDRFDETFRKLSGGKEMDYDGIISYLEAIAEFQSAPEIQRINKNSAAHEKLEIGQKKLEEQLSILNELSKRINTWANGHNAAGGLTNLALDIAFMYLSGGGSAIANSAKYVYSAAKYTTGQAAKKLALKEGTQLVFKESAAALSSIVTSSAETAAFFQARNALGAIQDGKVTKEEVAMLDEGFTGLFKFGVVGSTLAGPIGQKSAELINKIFNSEKAIASTIKLAVEGKGTTLDKVLSALSKNSNVVAKVTEFGTSFGINAGYMAAADDMDYDEAMGSLAQMDAVSKLIAAMLGHKNTAFLTPQKVHQIKKSLAGYEVNLAVYKGKKIYEVTDKNGEKTRLANEEEVVLFIFDKVLTESSAQKNNNQSGIESRIATANSREEFAATLDESKAIGVRENNGVNNGVKPETTEPSSQTKRPQGETLKPSEKVNSLLEASQENPAKLTETKVREEWQQKDVHTGVKDEPVDLFNLDLETGLKEPASEIHDEVTDLIFKGKLGKELGKRFDIARKAFEAALTKRQGDIQKLAEKYPNNNQAFAQGIVNILCEEFGMKGFEPKIKIDNKNKSNDFDFANGIITLKSDLSNKNDIIEVVAHEFNHALQFADVFAQYGVDGVKDMVFKQYEDVVIEDAFLAQQLTENIEASINNPYMQKLVENINNLQFSPEGSLNNYLTRIYKEEISNIVGIDHPNYLGQLTEREAYYVGNGSTKEIKVQEGQKELTDAEVAKLKQENPNITEMEDGTLFAITDSGEVTLFGKRAKLSGTTVESGIKTNELDKSPRKSVTSFSDLLVDEHISNKEANAILRECGLSEQEIADLRNEIREPFNSLVEALEILSHFDADINIKKMSVEEIKQLLKDCLNDKNTLYAAKFYNNKNFKLLIETLNIKNEKEVAEFFGDIVFDKDEQAEHEQNLAKAVEISEISGCSLSEVLKCLHGYETDRIAQLTPERLRAQKAISEALGIEFSTWAAEDIKNPEKITPEFLENFGVQAAKLRELGIDPNYNRGGIWKDPVEISLEIEDMITKCENAGLNFSWYKTVFTDTLSLDQLRKLCKQEDLAKVKAFIDACSSECKKKYPNYVIDYASNKKALDDIEGYTAILNTMVGFKTNINKYDLQSPQNFILKLEEIGVTDFQGVAKLLQAFDDAGQFPSSNHFITDFKIKNGDYDNAVKFVRQLKEFFGDYEDTGISGKVIKNYITYHWKSDVDFQTAVKKMERILNNDNIQKNRYTISSFIRSENPQAVELFELLSEYGFTCDSLVYDILMDNKYNIDNIEQAIDVFLEETAMNNSLPEVATETVLKALQYANDSYSTYLLKHMIDNNCFDYKKVKETTSKKFDFNLGVNVVNKALIVELLTDKELDFPISQVHRIAKNTNAFNIEFARKLCRDKEFPKESIANIILAVREDKNEKLFEEYIQLIKDALANKDLLKSGLEDITDEDIYTAMANPETIRALDLLGKGNLEAAFPLMLEEFREFVNEVNTLGRLSAENFELLTQKINPQQSLKYKELNNDITTLKKRLNEVIGDENLAKIKELQTKKTQTDEQIKLLKQGENAQTAEVKQQIKELQKQSKALGAQAQSIYYQSENAAQIKEIMNSINAKQKEMKNFILENSGIEPQDLVTKLRVLSALSKISTGEEMTEFINMLKRNTPENETIWNEAVNMKIFQKLGIEYDEVLSQKLDLMHCKYISKLFISSEEFFDNMRKLVEIVRDNPTLTVEQALDNLPQNIETKKMFAELGFDYEKFTKVDKNSYTQVEIKLNAEEAKQAAIKNLEEDLNDALFQSLPKEVTEPIFKQLKEKFGIEFVKSQKDNWVGDGFSAGSTEYYRLVKDGNPIVFEDMSDIVSLIKSEINSNDFWTTKNPDAQIENARGTMYTHLIKMRTQEVDNASSIKDGETANIEIHKTDMYDIKKALGLGNDAQCCTALGRNFNEWSAPNYIMNKCIGAIELTDKSSFVGNTMIYLAYVDGKPALVLDNIELKTKYQNNDRIRNTFVEYAKQLCSEIGQPDLPIFAGPNRHKLNMEIYPKNVHSMEIIGNSGNDKVYVDYDARGHYVGQGEKANITMYQIR